LASADVTIRGAGVFGLSVAYACLRRGASVCVVDPNGVAAGASGGIVGALQPHTPENWNDKKQFQFESLILARDFWREVEAIGGMQTGYVRSGRLQSVADDRALEMARARAIGAAELWRGQATWDVVRAKDSAAWQPASATGWVIHDTLSAQIQPRQATRALAASVRALGGQILTEGPDAGKTVWANGAAGLEALSKGRKRTVGQGVKGQGALLAFEAGDVAQIYANELHFVPHRDGTVAVGSTTENTFDFLGTDCLLNDVIAKARATLPCLADAPVVERWAGVRPRARSRAPMLGEWPDKPGYYVANGGFKIGFGMAPKVGQVMADLVLENRVSYPDSFDVTASL